MYVLFEGIDGVGKSTQIARLAQIYPHAVVTKEPGGTALGERLRKILLGSNDIGKRAEILLFLADRAEHYEKVIAKNESKLIMSDRGLVSGIAYAAANGFADVNELLNLNKFALNSHLPEKIVFFEADENLLKERVFSRKIDGIEARGVEYLLSVQEKMKQILTLLDAKILRIDASENEEKITNLIKEFIDD